MKTNSLIDAKRNEVLELIENHGYRRHDLNDGCSFRVNSPDLISSLIDMTEGGEIQIQVDLRIEVDDLGDALYRVTAHLYSTMGTPAERVLNLVLGRFIEPGQHYYASGGAATAFTKTVNALSSISSAIVS